MRTHPGRSWSVAYAEIEQVHVPVERQLTIQVELRVPEPRCCLCAADGAGPDGDGD